MAVVAEVADVLDFDVFDGPAATVGENGGHDVDTVVKAVLDGQVVVPLTGVFFGKTASNEIPRLVFDFTSLEFEEFGEEFIDAGFDAPDKIASAVDMFVGEFAVVLFLSEGELELHDGVGFGFFAGLAGGLVALGVRKCGEKHG